MNDYRFRWQPEEGQWYFIQVAYQSGTQEGGAQLCAGGGCVLGSVGLRVDNHMDGETNGDTFTGVDGHVYGSGQLVDAGAHTRPQQARGARFLDHACSPSILRICAPPDLRTSTRHASAERSFVASTLTHHPSPVSTRTDWARRALQPPSQHLPHCAAKDFSSPAAYIL